MAKKSGKKRTTTPTTAAGLITYFEEEIGGLRIRPELVVVLALGLMLLVIVAHLVAPVPP